MSLRVGPPKADETTATLMYILWPQRPQCSTDTALGSRLYTLRPRLLVRESVYILQIFGQAVVAFALGRHHLKKTLPRNSARQSQSMGEKNINSIE